MGGAWVNGMGDRATRVERITIPVCTVQPDALALLPQGPSLPPCTCHTSDLTPELVPTHERSLAATTTERPCCGPSKASP